jgi:hypothetical protein
VKHVRVRVRVCTGDLERGAKQLMVGRRQLSADAGVFLLDQGCLLVVTGGMVRDRVWSGVRDL